MLAQCSFTEDQTLRASDAAALDQLGASIALHGDLALVGAPQDDHVFGNAGSAYLLQFDGQTWQEIQKLTASMPRPSAAFGEAVALDSDVVVVSSKLQSSVYVYRRHGTAWLEEQVLRGVGTSPVPYFGASLAILDDVIAVGAPLDFKTTTFPQTGAVHIFRFNGSRWNLEAKIAPATGSNMEYFGASVALEGNLLVVGTPFDLIGGSHQGSASIFQYQGTGWVLLQKILSPLTRRQDQFGTAVDISGGTVVVGAVESHRSPSAGAAYVYRQQGTAWNLEQRIQSSHAEDGDRFGVALACEGNTLLVGAPGRKTQRGNAFLYRFNGTAWQEARKFRLGRRAILDKLGTAVALQGTLAMATAPGQDLSSLQGVGSVLTYAAGGFAVDVDPQSPRLLDTVNWTACGEPGRPILLLTGSLPQLGPTVISDVFDAAGEWTFSGILQVSPGMIDVPFTMLSLDSQGNILTSNTTVLSFP
jgi:hypothetical protein